MNASDDVVWISKEFGTVSTYDGLDSAMDDLSKALEAQKRGEWKGLHLDILESYDSSHYVSIQGQRPEDAVERAQRLYDLKNYEAREREQYERLREKYGTVEEKKG